MFILYIYLTDIMTQTVKVVDRKLVSLAGTVTLVLNILLLPNHLLTKVTVPAIDTSLLSITQTVWVLVSFKYIYKMNIFYGEGKDKCFLNAVTHCSLTLSLNLPQIFKYINSITVLTKVTLPSEILHLAKGHGQCDVYYILIYTIYHHMIYNKSGNVEMC